MTSPIQLLESLTGKPLTQEAWGLCIPGRRRISFDVKDKMKQHGYNLIETDYDDEDRLWRYWYTIKPITDDTQTIKTQHN